MKDRAAPRYWYIDLAKAGSTIMIAVFHFWAQYGESARGGFIAVEFFFIVSGFFLVKQHEAQSQRMTPLQYLWSRVVKLYPHYIFSFAVIFLYRNLVQSGNGLGQTLNNLSKTIPEILMLYGTILSDEKTGIYNSMTWYLSVLLLVGYVLWALLDRHKNAVLTAAPVISFWIYAYMYYTLGTVNNWRTHVFGVLNYAVLRAVAGLLLGIFCWEIKQKVQKTPTRGGGVI